MPVSKHPDISKQSQSHELQHLKAHNCSAELCPQTYLPCIVSNTQNIVGWWWQALFWRDDTVMDGALRVLFPPSCSLLKHAGGGGGKEGTFWSSDWSVGVPKPSEGAALKQLSLFQAIFCDSRARGIQTNDTNFFVANTRFFFIGMKTWIQQRKETAAAMPGS